MVPASPSATEASLIDSAGTVGPPKAVSEKSSTASPSSAPGIRSLSAHRIQNVLPGGMLRPVMVALSADDDVLPFSAPTVPDTTGLEKSSASCPSRSRW